MAEHLQDAPRASSLTELLERRAAAAPEERAYTFLADGESEAGVLSWGELEGKACSLASVLAQAFPPGERVVLLYPAGLDFLVAFFGCLLARLIPAPCEIPRNERSFPRFRAIVEDCQPAVLLTTGQVVAQMQTRLSSHPEFNRLLANLEVMTTEDLRPASGFRRARIQPEAPAYLQYTSGSTADPKGVMVTHANVLHNLAAIDETFQHNEGSVSVTWLPHFHDMGLVYGLLQPLYNGFRCYVMPPAAFIQSPVRWLRAIAKYRATHSGGPNFAYELCVRKVSAKQAAELDLSSWRVAFNGAEPIRASTLEAFAAKFFASGFMRESFHPAYGLAEATLKVTSRDPARPVRVHCEEGREIVSCGRPAQGIEVRIVDPETAQKLAEGQTGEIWVSGPSVAQGYWRRPQETIATFGAELDDEPGRFLRTGDLGFVRDGELYVSGRLKDLIIIRGRNHYPQDIELTVEMAHAAVRPGAVAAFAVEDGGAERLVVTAELDRGREKYATEVVASIRRAVAEAHEIPVWCVVLLRTGTISKTTSGKIQRRLMRDRFLARDLEIILQDTQPEEALMSGRAEIPGADMTVRPVSARNQAMEEWLRDEAAKALHLDPAALDVTRPLTELGLDSLAAAQLKGAVEERLQVELSLNAVLDGASLAELGQQIAAELENEPATGLPVLRRHPELQRAPASYDQERLWLLDKLSPGNAGLHVPVAVRLTGELHIALLKEAVRQVVARHSSLRTVFTTEGDSLLQVIREAAEVEWGLQYAAGPEATMQALSQWVEQPFDLAEGPLLRCGLIAAPTGEHIFAVVFHHAIADLNSAALFLREVAEIYSALRRAGRPNLPAVAYEYKDYAIWQREMMASGAWQGHIAFWAQQLEKLSGFDWYLSADKKLSATPAQVTFAIAPETLARLRGLAQANRATLFMALLAAYQTLLARYTGATDVLTGVPVANRPRPELQTVIGFFAYPLPVRSDLSGNPTFTEILARVREAALEAYRHQDLPFAQIATLASGPGSRTVLSQALLSLARDPAEGVRFDGLEVVSLDAVPAPSDFDLFTTLIESPAGVRGQMSFRPGVFDLDTARELAESFIRILEAVVKRPDTPLASLELSAGLESRARRVRARHEQQTIAVAATFTAEPVEQPLAWWFDLLGRPSRILFAPYGQVFQELLDPQSSLQRAEGPVCVLLRLADWLKGGEDGLRDDIERLLGALESSARRTRRPHLLVLCPSPGNGEVYQEPARVLAQGASRIPGVQVLESENIAGWYPVSRIHNPHGEVLGHVPYTPEYFTALASAVARRLSALERGPRKVIAVDCDQTLWSGVCGEDGPQGVVLDEERLALQRWLVEQQARGFLIALCSKNNEEDVWAVFDHRPEMVLRREHITAWRLNWDPKPLNLRALASELNLGVDSLVFIDDNPLECAAVRAELPEVLTLELPSAQIRQFLEHVWPLDVLAVTDEDRRRSALYAAEARRRAFERAAPTLKEFIQGLDLKIDIRPASPSDLPRAAQLTQRTNQFNTTARRRTQAELEQENCLVVRVADRFGDYGLVGVMTYQIDGQKLRVDSLLLSCRALGRGVEHRMVAHLGQLALQKGVACIEIAFRPTPKNKPALRFLEQISGGGHHAGGEGWVYQLPAAEAERLEFEPNDSSMPEEEDGVGETAGPVLSRADAQSELWQRIAAEYREVAAIARAVQAGARRKASDDVPYAPPRTPLERRLAEMWAEALGLERVGVDRDFFDLGGHSLLAVQLLTRVRDELHVDLPLDVVFSEAFTVGELAKAIELYEIQQMGEDAEALLAEIESLSEEEVRRLLESGGDNVGGLHP